MQRAPILYVSINSLHEKIVQSTISCKLFLRNNSCLGKFMKRKTLGGRTLGSVYQRKKTISNDISQESLSDIGHHPQRYLLLSLIFLKWEQRLFLIFSNRFTKTISVIRNCHSFHYDQCHCTMRSLLILIALLLSNLLLFLFVVYFPK